jgi:Cu+-exporting ATPase
MTPTAPTTSTPHPDTARADATVAGEPVNAANGVLDIAGMTCAACVNRVEKVLTKVEGVHAATVNLAAETATVHYDPTVVDLAALCGAVTKAGYAGTPRAAPRTVADPSSRQTPVESRDAADDERGARKDAELRSLQRRWQVALTTGLSLMAVMYVPIYLDTMDWLMPLILVVATGVQFWAGAAPS